MDAGRARDFGWFRSAGESRGRSRAPRSMYYRISMEAGYLRAELFERTTAEETREFLEAILAAAVEHDASRLLVSVFRSRPIFKVEQYGLLDYFSKAIEKSSHRIAMVGDTPEIRLSQKYIEFLAWQRGVNLECFGDEAEAVEWLMSD
jgi:hypothetical protein